MALKNQEIQREKYKQLLQLAITAGIEDLEQNSEQVQDDDAEEQADEQDQKADIFKHTHVDIEQPVNDLSPSNTQSSNKIAIQDHNIG